MSTLAKIEYLEDINNNIAQALAYLQVGRQLENLDLESEYPCKILYENITTDEVYYVENIDTETEEKFELTFFNY